MLISSATKVHLTTLPETLHLDAYHLRRAQVELNYLTDATAMVTTLTCLAPHAKGAISGLVDLLCPGTEDIRSEDTEQRIHILLTGIENEAERISTCKALFRSIQTTDAVRQIVHLRVQRLVRTMMTSNVNPAMTVEPTMRLLFSLFERTVAKIQRLTTVNRGVHAERYSALMKAAALEIQGTGK